MVAKRIAQQIRSVERLLQEYQHGGGSPLARFLTGFYKRNRQMGSSDRRIVSRLAYQYFRLGFAAGQSDLPVRLAIADFLCNRESELTSSLPAALHGQTQLDLDAKLALLEAHTLFRLADVFPFSSQLSAGIDHREFVKSFFIQPDLFIRLRPDHASEVLTALEDQDIPHKTIDGYTVALPNGTTLERVIGIKGKYEVQDYASQQIGRYFNAVSGERWWDACAGAGGKSLLLLATYPGVQLLVSDVRASILRNLDERFEDAGITAYRKKIIDLTGDPATILGGEQFDGIVLDAPCSGSGTWGRTPESVSTFDVTEINRFAALQKQIAANVIKHLKPGKPLIYSTCSAFAEENEDVVDDLQRRHGMLVEHAGVVPGYKQRADTMFVARLIKA